MKKSETRKLMMDSMNAGMKIAETNPEELFKLKDSGDELQRLSEEVQAVIKSFTNPTIPQVKEVLEKFERMSEIVNYMRLMGVSNKTLDKFAIDVTEQIRELRMMCSE